MKCIKCEHENSGADLKCENCRATLPQVKDFSLSDTVGSIFYKDDLPAETEEKKACNFIPMIKLEEAVDLLLEGEITDEEFEEKLDLALEPLIEIKEMMDNLSQEQWQIANQGISMVKEGYNQFKEAIKEILLFLESDDDSHIKRGLNMARVSSEIFKKAFLVGKEEIKKVGN